MRSHWFAKSCDLSPDGEDTEETREHRGLILPQRHRDHGAPELEKIYDSPKLRVLCVSVVIYFLWVLLTPARPCSRPSRWLLANQRLRIQQLLNSCNS